MRGESIHAYHAHNDNRVLALHRWLDGIGGDVVVVASLNETTLRQYSLGFPGAGRWVEAFNSDFYDHFPNPSVSGNAGGITADGPPQDELPASALITIPANSVVVFAREM